MANKKIPITPEIENIFGKKHQFVKEDPATGDPIVRPEDKDKAPGQQRYQTEPGNTLDLLERFVQSIPRWAFWQKDSGHIARIMSAVNDARLVKDVKGPMLTLAEGDHLWLVGSGDSKTVGILDRKMPASARAEAKVDSEEPEAIPTVGMSVWGTNEDHFRKLLKAK
jgi:hypothetical protein|tara:strand:+ start:247 stop:747 length:501 start_codon:yes stop_codon:yes gene_type:complete